MVAARKRVILLRKECWHLDCQIVHFPFLRGNLTGPKVPTRSINLRAEASSDETPIRSDKLRQLALLQCLPNNKRHHVDVDQLPTGITNWELIASHLRTNRCQVEGLYSVLVTYLRMKLCACLDVLFRKTNTARPVLEKLFPDVSHDILAAPKLGEDGVLVVESVKENLWDQLLDTFACCHLTTNVKESIWNSESYLLQTLVLDKQQWVKRAAVGWNSTDMWHFYHHNVVFDICLVLGLPEMPFQPWAELSFSDRSGFGSDPLPPLQFENFSHIIPARFISGSLPQFCVPFIYRKTTMPLPQLNS